MSMAREQLLEVAISPGQPFVLAKVEGSDGPTRTGDVRVAYLR